MVRRTAIPEGAGHLPETVLLLDTVGELSGAYAAADLAFVGGSLVPKGGHNVLEPSWHGVPTIVGPHMENFREIADAFLAGDALIRVAGEEELADRVDAVRGGSPPLPRDRPAREGIARNVPRRLRGEHGRGRVGASGPRGAEMILGAAARVRRILSSAGLLPASLLPRPVVSVGNLVMGGAGKTPHVIHLARWLTGQGRRVGILSRGYGRKTRGVRWVSDGEGPIATAAEAGDEPVLIARSLPGIPVAVGESRAAAGREVLSRRRVDVFLLDDGFQHLSLRRDADLLLVECGQGAREPVDGAAGTAAGAAVPRAVRGRAGDHEMSRRGIRGADGAVRPHPFGRPRAFSRLSPGGIVGRDGLPSKDAAAGSAVFAFSGLARNAQFRDTLEAAGFRVKGFLPFPDHHAYGRGDLDRIAREAGGLPAITTEKDLVRLPGDVPFSVGALRVEVEYLEGWDGISRMILSRLEGGSLS